MEAGIRDDTLRQGEWNSLSEGLSELGLSRIELGFDRAGTIQCPFRGSRVRPDSEEGSAAAGRLCDAGIGVAALLCAQDFNAAEPEAEIDWIVRAVAAAERLGAGAVRVDSIMSGQSSLPLEERAEIFSRGLVEVLRRTAGSDVSLAIENHGPQGNDPVWMESVLRRTASPRVGLTLDLGNWYWFGHPLSRVYEIYEQFAPLVRATHVKNIAYPADMREAKREVGWEYASRCCPVDEGDIDLVRAAGILSAGGYDGCLTLEDESLGRYPVEERRRILERDVACMRAAIAAA